MCIKLELLHDVMLSIFVVAEQNTSFLAVVSMQFLRACTKQYVLSVLQKEFETLHESIQPLVDI